MKIINLLWTGGWDSTFRLVQLSRKNIEVNPIYIIDPDRISTKDELEAMEKILHLLKEKKETKAKINPIIKICLEDLKPNDDLLASYKAIKEHVRLGTQYSWLPLITEKYGIVEIGIEKPSGEYSGCVDAINKFGSLKEYGDSYILDNSKSTKDCINIFENFSFPIIKISEVEMKEYIRKWKYEDVMKLIWFCHNPVNNQPCGICRPCQQKMECDMKWLLPEYSQNRYNKWKMVKKYFGENIADYYARLIRKINRTFAS